MLGEGAGIVVLESEEHARARGAKIYAVAAGVGITSDGHHISAPEPTGIGGKTAMLTAVADAGLSAADIRHVNAHATSTPVGDEIEARAIREALPGAPLVTSTKSMTGHLLGGAGGIESIFTILALSERIVPATANLDDPADGLDVDIVRRRAAQAPRRPARRDQQLLRLRRPQRRRRLHLCLISRGTQ